MGGCERGCDRRIGWQRPQIATASRGLQPRTGTARHERGPQLADPIGRAAHRVSLDLAERGADRGRRRWQRSVASWPCSGAAPAANRARTSSASGTRTLTLGPGPLSVTRPPPGLALAPHPSPNGAGSISGVRQPDTNHGAWPPIILLVMRPQWLDAGQKYGVVSILAGRSAATGRAPRGQASKPPASQRQAFAASAPQPRPRPSSPAASSLDPPGLQPRASRPEPRSLARHPMLSPAAGLAVIACTTSC